MATISLLVGGTLKDTKNLWQVAYDTVAQTLTITNSWCIGTPAATPIVYAMTRDASGNMYFGTSENKVYKYTSSMVLDTSWAVSGIYNLGTTINGLDADYLGWLAIGHLLTGGTKSITLLDSSGTVVWQNNGQSGTTVSTKDLKFALDGNIIGCGSRVSGGNNACRYLRLDGSKKVNIWSRSGGAVATGLCQWPNGDFAVVVDDYWIGKFDKNFTAYWVSGLVGLGTPYKIDYNSSDEIYVTIVRTSSLSLKRVASDGSSILSSYDTGANQLQVKVSRSSDADIVFSVGVGGTDSDAGLGNLRAFTTDLTRLAFLDIGTDSMLYSIILSDDIPPTPDPATTIWDGLQGAWPLDDDAANTTVKDISGNERNGVASRNTQVLHAVGHFGGAFDFDQSLPDNVNCGDMDTIDLAANQDIAIALWLQRGVIEAGYGTLLHKYKSAPTSKGFAIYCDHDTDQVGVTALFPTQYVASLSTEDIDSWAFVVVNIDRNGFMELIINNGDGYAATSISADAASDASNNIALMFGQNCNINANFDDYDGLLDAIEVWNRCLTWDEIDYLFTQGLATAPTITDQSLDTIVNESDEVNLFVTASGNPTPSYQWYKDDVLIPGETNSTLSLTADRTDSGTYTCRVYNVAGEDWSDPIVLTVQYLELTAQSSDTISINGELVTIYVTVIGFPTPSYQWYKDDVLIPGETNSTLSFYSTFSDDGIYKCQATNAFGSVTSTDIKLTVVDNPYKYNLFDLNLDINRGS